eukprot:3155309-Lingulodinium_polyedra.AAC.1
MSSCGASSGGCGGSCAADLPLWLQGRRLDARGTWARQCSWFRAGAARAGCGRFGVPPSSWRAR